MGRPALWYGNHWCGAQVLRPRWVACEQVPEARGAFGLIAHELSLIGYRVWVGILSAECYGVPQTRKRVYLMASRDPFTVPAPTHQAYRKNKPARPVGLFDGSSRGYR